MDPLPVYNQINRRSDRPPGYVDNEREERRPKEDPRPRVISFPVELELNYRTRGHWGALAERHSERANLDFTTSFEDIQQQLRSKHLQHTPSSAQNRSFTWTTWLKYANGQRRQVREDNWDYVLGEIMALGSAREGRDPRRGDFPTALVTQSNKMSEEIWEQLRHGIARDEGRWGVEGWKGYMLLRGYWFKDLRHQQNRKDRQERKEGQQRKDSLGTTSASRGLAPYGLKRIGVQKVEDERSVAFLTVHTSL
ncbi:hypothetical protein M409DRAFT_54055 [Zasmidium cellare ATCC 36951]|uniref:Uncharacterized protein n=1 Tax=Zasmidium cellare ATCC 36951 TaxID=1080233 RepID=A0A6A6CJQ7_ZASCE|nr:uncharacterized protein M409DRAFT_54055 [Zasmidium cellare ATCC 36951]KAF2167457.1 hypothetical protein M409DRAFT_54055 [Zasmidium cellare ATCC 36951]